MKILTKQHDLLKSKLKFSKEKFEKVEKDQIALAQDMCGKTLDENELALQNLIIFGFERIKLAFMIYGVSKRKREGLGYYQNPYNPRTCLLVKP